MHVEALGPFAVAVGRRSITPTAPKPRTLLAALILAGERVVPVAELIGELWGAHPPRSAQTALQSYVSGIRKTLGRALPQHEAKLILRTERGGYLFHFPEARIDVNDFEQLTAVGFQSFAERDYRTARDRFRDALAMWQGRILDDVRAGPLLATEIRRLEAARVTVLRYWVESCAAAEAPAPFTIAPAGLDEHRAWPPSARRSPSGVGWPTGGAVPRATVGAGQRAPSA